MHFAGSHTEGGRWGVGGEASEKATEDHRAVGVGGLGGPSRTPRTKVGGGGGAGDTPSVKFPFGPAEGDRLGAWHTPARHTRPAEAASSGRGSVGVGRGSLQPPSLSQSAAQVLPRLSHQRPCRWLVLRPERGGTTSVPAPSGRSFAPFCSWSSPRPTHPRRKGSSWTTQHLPLWGLPRVFQLLVPVALASDEALGSAGGLLRGSRGSCRIICGGKGRDV